MAETLVAKLLHTHLVDGLLVQGKEVQLRVDHVLLATGYRVDILRHQFLAPDIGGAIRCVNGYPELVAGLESSVPGLHFLGAPAAWSFGPLMRFVSGTGYTARALTRCVVRNTKKSVYSAETVWQPANLRRDG